MGAVLLDTTVLIDLLRGRPDAQRRVRALHAGGDDAYACAVNGEEIFRGLFEHEREFAERLISGLRVAPLGVAEGRRAGEWRREYARRGRTLTQADCLIAASAVSVGARLATGNPTDFPMPEIEVEHWPAGA